MRATVVCNPTAGKHDRSHSLQSAIRVLEEGGWTLTVSYTSGAGDATRVAQSAVNAEHQVVVAVGGDGTVNEVIQALAHTDTALGYIPLGTVNVWARELSIPLDAQGAAQALVHGRTIRIDLGMAGERYFLLMAGIGFDGEVIRRARMLERHKARFGVFPYLASGISTAALYRGADIELRYDGIIRRVQALMLVLGNTRLYGGYFQLTPDAVANDGWLDLCIVKGRGPLAVARQSLPLLFFRSTTHADVEMVRVKDLTVGADEPLPFQMDGELVGVTPVRFRVAPRALAAIIPRDFASSLIA